MNINYIKDILVQRGYNKRNAEIVAKELTEISSALSPLLNRWLNDENCHENYRVEEHSINDFMKQGMKYPAALLTIDWLIKEPKVALRSLTKGRK